ncbi:MAG: family intrarane metalloprotease [Frankiales bacterium]|nr:family intrarane metalloprotease [Frankiales bacterium]
MTLELDARPTSPAGWALEPPPGWPTPPPGWSPPTGWSPDPTWPKPPRGWKTWLPGVPHPESQPPAVPSRDLTWAEPLGSPAADEPTRRRTRQEVLVALSVFPLPALITALVLLVRSAVEGTTPSQITDVLPHHHALSSVLGALLYATGGSSVLLALFLLSVSGVTMRSIGLTRKGLGADAGYGLGIVFAGFGIAFALTLLVFSIFGDHGLPGAVQTNNKHYAAVFLLQGYVVSVVTAFVEESMMSAYLLTRLGQLGWTPRKALWLSLAIRTSYHAYYGIGFLFTIPIGYLLTRSFQRRRRLLRTVGAHALYDACLFTLAILGS